MKKKICAIFILAVSVLNTSPAAICMDHEKNDSDIDIILRPVERTLIITEKEVINAKYNLNNGILYISFERNIDNVNIVVYDNGNEIINDNLQVNSDNTIAYNISGYDYGEYKIVITTEDGDIYVGTFSSIPPIEEIPAYNH